MKPKTSWYFSKLTTTPISFTSWIFPSMTQPMRNPSTHFTSDPSESIACNLAIWIGEDSPGLKIFEYLVNLTKRVVSKMARFKRWSQKLTQNNIHKKHKDLQMITENSIIWCQSCLPSPPEENILEWRMHQSNCKTTASRKLLLFLFHYSPKRGRREREWCVKHQNFFENHNCRRLAVSSSPTSRILLRTDCPM